MRATKWGKHLRRTRNSIDCVISDVGCRDSFISVTLTERDANSDGTHNTMSLHMNQEEAAILIQRLSSYIMK